MMGRLNTASRTTDAPMIPVLAASMAPISATVTAMPPRTLPNSSWVEVSKRSAMPDLSSMLPIKMNVVPAMRIQLVMRP